VIGHRSSNELLADKPPFLREVSDSLVSAEKKPANSTNFGNPPGLLP
jgi:hypothetical protein